MGDRFEAAARPGGDPLRKIWMACPKSRRAALIKGTGSRCASVRAIIPRTGSNPNHPGLVYRAVSFDRIFPSSNAKTVLTGALPVASRPPTM